jgi:protein-arginine kinase activator protein McsA
MKRCTKCERDLPIDAFAHKNKERTRRYSICKECKNAYNRQHYQNNKERYKQTHYPSRDKARAESRKLVWDHLCNNPCVRCGEDNPFILEFNHIDPSTKRFSVSQGCGRRSPKLVAEEIEKCEILCVKCHRIHTAIEQNYWSDMLTEEQRTKWLKVEVCGIEPR